MYLGRQGRVCKCPLQEIKDSGFLWENFRNRYLKRKLRDHKLPWKIILKWKNLKLKTIEGQFIWKKPSRENKKSSTYRTMILWATPQNPFWKAKATLTK